VDGFDLSGLIQPGGEPVNDLNDATCLTSTEEADLNQLFRMP
jgi:hypothetical protein